MSLTITQEDGTGKADANSYASVSDCDAYHEGHLYIKFWDEASDTSRIAALVMATRLIDAEYQFNGVRTLAAQALEWPRMDCPEPSGTTAQFVAAGGSPITPKYIIPGGSGKIITMLNPMLVPGNIVPRSVVEATCELARELLTVDRTAAWAGEGLKYDNISATTGVGAQQIGYDATTRPPVIPRVVQAMLAKYGSMFSAKSGAVRLMRT